MRVQNQISEIKVSYQQSLLNAQKIASSMDAYKNFKAHWDNNLLELVEESKVMFLNYRNQVLGILDLSRGGTTSTIVDPKMIFSVALKCNAHGIILAHNHPSGNPNASHLDLALTKKLRRGAEILGMELLNHLILTSCGYTSLSDEGLM